jgi:8-oxo-dGTP diphosphatase
MPFPEGIPAASALVFRGGRLLLVRSTRTREHWAFPGGKSEPGETPEQTAVREVREEVGLDIEVTGAIGRYVLPSGYAIACFSATAGGTGLTVDSSEILEARWFTPQESLQLNLVYTVRDAIEKFTASLPPRSPPPG